MIKNEEGQCEEMGCENEVKLYENDLTSRLLYKFIMLGKKHNIIF